MQSKQKKRGFSFLTLLSRVNFLKSFQNLQTLQSLHTFQTLQTYKNLQNSANIANIHAVQRHSLLSGHDLGILIFENVKGTGNQRWNKREK